VAEGRGNVPQLSSEGRDPEDGEMTDATYDALMRTIREAPDDDLPRLILADRLEETGQPSRAEYIRAAVSLARCGPTHKMMSGLTSLRSRGPNYWTISSADDQATYFGLEDGDRVDVNPAGKAKYGLLVKRKIVSRIQDEEEVETVLIRDDRSKPWEGGPYRDRMKEMLQHADERWTHPFIFNRLGSLANVTDLDFDRGLIDRVELKIGTWDRLSDEVRDPVQTVCLTDVVPDQFETGSWVWFRDDVPGRRISPASVAVPYRIHEALEGWTPWVDGQDQSPCKRYDTREAAFAVMTAALRKLWPWVREWTRLFTSPT